MNSVFSTNRGFTLIEVLATLAIIAILGLVAIPSVLSTIRKGENSSYYLLIGDIKVAGQQLFEELEYSKTTLFKYDSTGKTNESIQITKKGTNENQISTNLQSLVSNGFLTGVQNNEKFSANANDKVILNPKNNNDMGNCPIKIIKKKDNKGKVYYEYEGLNNDSDQVCPTNKDMKE